MLFRSSDWECIDIHRKDNPSLDEDEYLKQLGPIPPAFRAAWIDGVRMDARTLFEVHKTVDQGLLTDHGGQKRLTPLPASLLGQSYHYIQELPTVGGQPMLAVDWIQVYRAYDHGFFPDPAVCLWIAVLGKRIIAFHEETWFRTPPKEIAKLLKESTTELLGETAVAMTYADPDIDVRGRADHTVRDVLEMEGIPIECSVNDRVLYADMIHALLGEELEPGVPRFQVYEPGCPLLAKYLPKMRWDEKNPRKMADHKFDHWVVCLAYFAISSGVLSVSARPEVSARPAWMDWIEESNRRGLRHEGMR